MSELTGRTRYRSMRTVTRREVLVLQVEERGMRDEYVGGQVDSRPVTQWRDATVADLTTVGRQDLKRPATC